MGALRRTLRLAWSLAAIAAPSSPQAQDSVSSKHAAANAPLFTADAPVTIAIATDLKAFVKNRDSTADYTPATLTIAGAASEGGDGSAPIEVGIKSRGHFRRQKSNCDFPPVLIKFRGHTKETVFAHQDKLKLVTPCKPGNADYQQYILQEYLLYRVYNTLTPFSFRVRLANVTYQDVKNEMKPIAVQAFLIENEDAMAARNGGTVLKAKNAHREDVDTALVNTLSMFEYLIANTDWSISGLHNVRLVRLPNVFGVTFPVPYDFDWSGAVNPRYARPDPQLPIRTVEDRLYRGYCMPPADLEKTIALFNQKHTDINALYTTPALLEPQRAERTTKYYDDFYKIINDQHKLGQEIKRACVA
ncbi:MAG TPA: hypothetical protein VEI06_06900 [Gemmatimonadaceae bacterium]|nr:hypothetical protein [Gemmatimonadaceae bacterium]